MAVSFLKEKWVQGVALTTTILAVCAALSTLKGGAFSTRTQIMTTLEANKWSYFQSKSIKQHTSELQRELLLIQKAQNNSPEASNLIDKDLEFINKDIVRYDKEKEEIKKEAEKLTSQEDNLKKHGGNFHIAIMLLQIGIMLCSVGALIQKRMMWIVGMIGGAIGIVYMINGFVLFF